MSEINYQFFQKSTNISYTGLKYLLLDLSTVADNSLYYDIIKRYFTIYDVYELKFNKRDVDHISLIDFVGVNILMTDVPIIYYVDRYISLGRNSLWVTLRNCDSDIIIDRNSNIVAFNDIKNN